MFVEQIAGHGDKCFILLHNAGGDHHFFTYQIETLKLFGNVIWFDLPGHSTSKSIESYKMADVALWVEEVCRNLGVSNGILVGLNNGGNIAVEMVLRKKFNVESLILIDPRIFMKDDFVEEVLDYIDILEGKELGTDFVDHAFLETSAQNKQIAREAFLKVDRPSLQETFRKLLDWDKHSSGLLRKITCPALCILTDEHNCTYERMKGEAPHFMLGKVVGSKVWPTLEVPDQLNAMIARFLQIL